MLIPFFQIFKIPETIFQIFKKAYLQISKYLFHTDNDFEGNNLHKNHYTNNSHKKPSQAQIKIYNHCIYAQNYYTKILYFFSLLYIRMNGKSINFNDKNIKKATFIIKTKKYLI